MSCAVNTDQERPEVRILLWRRNSLGQDDQDDASNDGDKGDDLDDGVSDGGGRKRSWRLGSLRSWFLLTDGG